jgi:polyhydroxyalkanoate synthesis regulator phasin
MLKQIGQTTVSKTGQKGNLSEDEYKAICSDFLTYLAIAQMNGDPEKKIAKDILPALEELFHHSGKKA